MRTGNWLTVGRGDWRWVGICVPVLAGKKEDVLRNSKEEVVGGRRSND